jgi:hypothetical protein
VKDKGEANRAGVIVEKSNALLAARGEGIEMAPK